MQKTLIHALAGLATATVTLTTAAHPAAAATLTTWKWGAIHSTDGMATAWGKVVAGQSGMAVTGNLDDSYGRGCSWALIKYQSAASGRWRTHGIYNCVPGTGTFRKSVGGVLRIRVQVCRGNAENPTGRCSRWKTVYTQGG